MNKQLVINHGQAINLTEATSIQVKVGDHYRVVINKDGQQIVVDDVIARQVGDDLVLTYADGTEVIIKDYYSVCAEGACSVSLPAENLSEITLADLPVSGQTLSDGSTLIYAYGDSTTLMTMAQGDTTLLSVLSSLEGSTITYPVSVSGVGIGDILLSLGGIALGGWAIANGTNDDENDIKQDYVNVTDTSVGDDAVATISDFAENDNATTASGFNPSLNLYTSAGIIGVGLENIAAINDVLNSALVTGSAADTVEKIQAFVDAYNAILNAADGNGDNDTNPTQAQYAAIGVTGVDTAAETSLLGDVVDRQNTAAVDTVAEVQALASAVQNVIDGAAGTAGEPTLADLQALGISGVTADNLAALQAAIAATPANGSGVSTLAALQSLVNNAASAAAAAVSTIQTAAENNNATLTAPFSPSVEDYAATGVSGVSAGNIAAINDALNSAAANGASVDTSAEISNLVNSYNAILNAADGNDDNDTNPTQAQYAAIGVTGVDTAAETSLLGDVVDRQNTAAVDTVAEVQALASAVQNVIDGAAGTAGEPTLADLQALGITGVTADNLAALQAAIAATPADGSGVSNVAAIQTLLGDVPVNTVPAAQFIDEDTLLSISGLSVTDSANNLASTQLSVTNGSVTVTLTGGATISSGTNGSNNLTLSGSEAAINASLATLSYQGNANFNGSDTLTVLSTDSTGTPLTDTDTVAITVSGVDDAPINTVPGAQTVNEDTALTISGLSVTDVDGNLASTQLSVTNGTVTVTLSGGATISAGANSSGSLTLSGSEAAINASLATLSYQGNANFNGSDTLTVLSTDSTGTPLTDTDTVAITVSGVDDAPINTVPGAQTVLEDTALTISGLSVTDVDGNLASTQLSVTNGTVTLTGGATISAGTNGSNNLTLSGSEAAINASLATVSYQGNLNFNGNDTLTVLSTDSTGTPLTDTDTVAITVSGVDDAPINTVPGAQTVNEDTALTISGLSVADGDGNLASTQLSVTNGTVTVTLTGGATISAGTNGSNNLTLSGSEAAINASLATLSYQGNLNFNGSDTLTVLSIGSTGTPLTDTDTVAITVSGVDDAPINTVPGAQTVNEDTALTISGLSVADGDGNLVSTQLSVTNGSVTVTLTGGATISAGTNGSNNLTLSGSEAAINASLATLSYQGNLNFNGSDTLTVLSTDSTGTPLTDTDTVAITVTSIDDAPINTVPGAQTVNEDTALTISGLSVTDVDGNLASTQLSVTNGTVTVTLTGGATISAGTNGSNNLTLSGSEAAINASLATLSYQGNLNFNGSDTLTVLSTDSTGTPLTDTDTVAITVSAVNDLPSLTLPNTQSVTEDTVLAISGVSINDVDGNLDIVTLTVTNGTLSVTLSGSAGISAGANNSNTITLSGSQTDINATLASLTYLGNANFNGADGIWFYVRDSGGLSTSATLNISVSSVADSPVNTVPAAQSVNEDTALTISGLSVTDPDGNLATTQLSVNNGMVTVTLTGGATISAGTNGSNNLTLSGSEAAINASLATLSYQGNANFNGSDTLTVLSTDSTGTPLTDTDTVAITVNSEPIAYQYFDTAGMAQDQLSDVGFDSNGDNSNTPSASGHISALDPTILANTHGPNTDDFAVRYETQWTVNNSGDYTFRITSDDGSILYVNPGQANNLTVNNDGNHGSVAQTGTVTLPVGTHKLIINYFEDSALETCSLAISGPDTGGNFVDISTLISSLSAPPIVIDLDGDGVEFIGLDAGYSLDMTDSGVANSTAFAAPDDAVLVFDADHNGLVSNTREFMFADYLEGASTDLEGLRFFDSNNDGFLSSEDNLYSDFHLWQDANLNGEVDTGEFISLSEAGLVSIGLTSDGEGYAAAGGSVWVHGTAQAQFSDGRSADVADAAFDYLPDAGVNLNLTDLSDKFMAAVESNIESTGDSNNLNVALTELLDIADHNSWLTGLEGSVEPTTSELVDQVNDTLVYDDLNNDNTYNFYTSEDSVNETLSSFNQYSIYTVL